MNLTQWLLLLVPTGLVYIYFVVAARSDGRVNHAANAAGGLIVVPVILGLLPIILLGAGMDLLRKRAWGPATLVFLVLVLVAGYGALIHHLRDRPPPAADDLPVEAPLAH